MDEAPELLLWGVPELRTPHSSVFAPERRFQLLVLLALHAGRWVERDRLAALLWPRHGAAEARRNLRKVIHNARALTLPGTLEAGAHAVRWAVRTDVLAFEDDLHAGRVERALAWRRAAPLAGIDDDANAELALWLAGERARIDQAWRTAALGQMHGQTDAAQRAFTARRLLAADALDESAMATLLEAGHALGRPLQALTEYRLYARRLAEELGVEPSRALRDLADAARTSTMPARAAGGGAAGKAAPIEAVDLIGRRHEMAEASALLARADCRALTLLGPGGIGKSSLARSLRVSCSPLFPGGAHWVELGDVDTLGAAVARLAQALGAVVRDDSDAAMQLARHASPQRTLLVLDNVEHLRELPALLQGLLDAAPALALLLTSRERPALAQGRVMALAGLEVPAAGRCDLAAASAFDAIRLFERRARLAQRDFSLAAHLGAVIDIAHSVAGMPLALELAASWVRLLPPQQIAQELRVSSDLLERDPAAPGVPARPQHASMRAVLEGSWSRLAPREREALAALSVFAGGFTRAAALAVAECSLPLLSSLADKTMLAVDADGRLALHPVVAQFAAQRLARDAPAHAAVVLRHAEWFVRRVADLSRHLRADQRRLVDELGVEFADARAAWRHAVAARRADLVLTMVPALRMYFELHGRLQEGIDELRPAVLLGAASPLTDRTAARALAQVRQALATLHFRRGDLAAALTISQQVLAPGQLSGEHSAAISCLLTAGGCLWSQGQPRAARTHYRRALKLARSTGDRHAVAASLGNLGIAERRLGDPARALTCYAEALAIERELGNPLATAVHLNNIGALHRSQRQWPQALQPMQEGLAHCAAHGVPSMVPYFELGLGLVHLERAQMSDARRHLAQALAGSQAFGLLQVDLSAELALARVEVAAGELASARPRLRRVAATARARQFNGLLVDTAIAYAGWLSAQGERARPAAILERCKAHPAADPDARERAASGLSALMPTGRHRRAAAAAATTLDAVIDEVAGTAGTEHV